MNNAIGKVLLTYKKQFYNRPYFIKYHLIVSEFIEVAILFSSQLVAAGEQKTTLRRSIYIGLQASRSFSNSLYVGQRSVLALLNAGLVNVQMFL